MSKRREVEQRITALNEIRNIMQSMKNLALMEAHKLARYHETQQRVVHSISRALNDVRRHYTEGELLSRTPPLYLVFGSERGFCGAYNEQLLELLAQQPGHEHAPLISVGSRLATTIQRDHPHAVCLTGAGVANEVAAVLGNIVATINQLRQQHGPLCVEVIHFHPEKHTPVCQPILPPLPPTTGDQLPPLINLPAPQLISELLDHYLFAVTHAWFFASLMSENQRRSQHLEQASHHLEHQQEALSTRRNTLRQEEIIEEIEVILLSSELVGKPGG